MLDVNLDVEFDNIQNSQVRKSVNNDQHEIFLDIVDHDDN